MSDYIWVSNAMMDSRIKLFVETDINTADPARAIEAQSLNDRGEPVPAELCPAKIWANRKAPQFDRMPIEAMPDLFYARAHWIVSQKAADVLRRYDLGGGALHPVRDGVFREDEKTRVAGEFYTWIFGNMKSAFLPDETPKKEPFGVSGLRWNMPFTLADMDIAVSAASLAPPDQWLDKTLFDAVFFSRALGDALDAAGLRRAFHLYKARVV